MACSHPSKPQNVNQSYVVKPVNLSGGQCSWCKLLFFIWARTGIDSNFDALLIIYIIIGGKYGHKRAGCPLLK